MSTHCITRFVDCDEIDHWPPNNLMIHAQLSNKYHYAPLEREDIVYGRARELVCVWRHHDGNPRAYGDHLKNILTFMHESENEYEPSNNDAGCRTAYVLGKLEKLYDLYPKLMPAGTHHIGEHFTYVVYFGSHKRTALQVIMARYDIDSGTSSRENLYFGPLEWFMPNDVEALAYPPESDE